ncbi:hypothetical protein LBW59_25890, partial [Ralstonia solanacearum]
MILYPALNTEILTLPLAQPYVLNQRADPGVALNLPRLALLAFVVRLAADANVAAGSADTHPLDELLRK